MKLKDYNKIISANWKMNGSLSLVKEFKRFFINRYEYIPKDLGIIICPPAPYLDQFSEVSKKYKNIYLGAQDCSLEENSPRTGDISASILKDIGCEYIILGHSERRRIFKENNKTICQKVKRSIDQNLKVIICVGEDEDEKNDSKTLNIIEDQIENSLTTLCSPENTIIAYEPVWSIGTGRIPELEEIEHINRYIQKKLNSKFEGKFNDNFKILYGGSVNPRNSKRLLSSNDIDGALIGGSSLAVEDFDKIINFQQ